ncbi:MAG TPA: NUDIX hydrolase [Alphaproteobacteria bacterium]|nr:NUDIX hydrolase [Alphaproteobacteria bacterium]
MPETTRPPGPGLKGPSVRAVPEGDNRERLMCPDCGFIQYDNPKIVVGAVVHWDGHVLLVKRAINPRRGFWTLPAGYLELNETTQEGALREAYEEARAKIALEGLLAVYNIPRLSQVQLIYRARLLSPAIAPGPESEEVGLFGWDKIPWDDLAFPSVRWALGHFREIGTAESFAVRTNPAGELGNML